MDGEGHVDAVILVFDVGRGDLYVDETLVQAVGRNGVGVALKVFFLQTIKKMNLVLYLGEDYKEKIKLSILFLIQIGTGRGTPSTARIW